MKGLLAQILLLKLFTETQGFQTTSTHLEVIRETALMSNLLQAEAIENEQLISCALHCATSNTSVCVLHQAQCTAAKFGVEQHDLITGLNSTSLVKPSAATDTSADATTTAASGPTYTEWQAVTSNDYRSYDILLKSPAVYLPLIDSTNPKIHKIGKYDFAGQEIATTIIPPALGEPYSIVFLPNLNRIIVGTKIFASVGHIISTDLDLSTLVDVSLPLTPGDIFFGLCVGNGNHVIATSHSQKKVYIYNILPTNTAIIVNQFNTPDKPYDVMINSNYVITVAFFLTKTIRRYSMTGVEIGSAQAINYQPWGMLHFDAVNLVIDQNNHKLFDETNATSDLWCGLESGPADSLKGLSKEGGRMAFSFRKTQVRIYTMNNDKVC